MTSFGDAILDPAPVPVDPSPLPAEVEEWFVRQALRVAERWDEFALEREPEPAYGVGDDEWFDLDSGTAGVRRGAADRDYRERLLAEWEHNARQIARLQADQVRVLASALELVTADGYVPPRHDRDLGVREIAAEFALAVGLSDRTVAAHMGDAWVIRDRFPTVYERMREGVLSRAHAQVIADEGNRLAAGEVRARYELLVLERGQRLTSGRLRALVRAIAQELEPLPIDERHREAREGRRVWVDDLDDAMAELHLLGPALLVHGIHDRLTRMGRSTAQASPDDQRTLDQRRADVMCDLLLTGHATAHEIDRDGGAGIDAIQGIVQVTIPAEVLTADAPSACESAVGEPSTDTPAAQRAAWLAGRCPIDSGSARRVAGNATVWDRLFADPVTSDILAVDRRFPSEAQRRLLRARDEHCRFPGCRAPVWRCDIDHTVDHRLGGPTDIGNLAHVCRWHHTMKHDTAWSVTQSGGGVLEWTSPLGRVYRDRPPPTLRFVPDTG